MQAQLTVTLADEEVAFRDLPSGAFFAFSASHGEAKIRRKIDESSCCGIGQNPVPLLMRPSAKVLPVSMPDIIRL